MRFPRVVIEGPDGAGKTSLIEWLQGQIDIPVMPRASTSQDGPIRDIRGYVDRDLLTHGEGGIYDRHPLISEPIYGPIIRGYMLPSFSESAWLRNAMAMFYGYNPVLVYCLPPWALVMDNVLRNHTNETEHQRGVIMRAQAIYDCYVARAARDFTKAVVYDYTQGHAKDHVLQAIAGRM